MKRLSGLIERLLIQMKTLVFRIYLLKIVCVILLTVIGFRLYQMQVTYSAEYNGYLQGTRAANLQKNVPRGVIYDRNMEVLVDNIAVNTITYQYSTKATVEEMRETAKKLAKLINVNTKKLTERDLQDLYILTFPDEAKALISDEEAKTLREGNKYYQRQLELIGKEQFAQLTNEDKKVQVIFNNMNQGNNTTTNIIKNDATDKEVAIVSENLINLPGIDVGVDWNRDYPSDMGQSSIFGRVSSYEQGLPATSKNEFLAYGYQLNDRVGTSQLESFYESLLSGYKSEYHVASGNENTSSTEIYEGQSGFQISLTIDSELQAAVNKIIENQLLKTKVNNSTARYLREAYVVMLNPNTGEILSMNGKIIEYNDKKSQYEIMDNALGTFQSAFTMGSVVKGATLLAGYEYDATSLGEVRNDTPLIFADGSKKASWRNLGPVNDATALMYSSNIYFMLQTIGMAGGSDSQSGRVSLANLDMGVFNIYRSFFSQFGLGVSTGIDLPNESKGLRERSLTPAKLLDYAIGQADTYTTMQLAQYVSTIATNGKRYGTQIVRDIYIPSTEEADKQLIKSFEPHLLNIIDLEEKYFERVHEGFELALQDSRGTGASVFNGANYNPAGKTGTAQEYARDAEGKLIKDKNGKFTAVHNTTFIGYAPADNPEIAIAVILPQAELPNNSNSSAQEIGRQAMQAYFDIQKTRYKK